MKSSNTGSRIQIWDSWVRIFHWSLALSIGFMLLSGNTGWQFFEWHRNVGEFILALLLFRIVWGLFGSSNARITSLFHHPRNAFTHLLQLVKGDVPQERGHNAAGSWAVIIIMSLISFQAITGLFIADEDELIEGAFHGTFGRDLSDTLWSWHHTVSKLIMILVGVHIVMVFIYLFRAGQNLITPMLTGRMKWLATEAPPTAKFTSNIVGLVLFLICLALVAFILGWVG